MENTPNARAKKTNGEVEYRRVSDTLKIRYRAEVDGKWLAYDPANLHIELNGQPLNTCDHVSVSITDGGVPRASLTFNLKEIDIDMDTLTALTAIVEAKPK